MAILRNTGVMRSTPTKALEVLFSILHIDLYVEQEATTTAIRVKNANCWQDSAMSLTLFSLGTFDDNGFPLNRHNFAQQTDRIFKASINMPMAANLAVILFE